MEDYVLTVCCTKMDKVRPLNPKMVIILMGVKTGVKTKYCSLHPWYCFLIVKWREGFYQNNQKWWWFFWNGGNLELEINLNAASTSAGTGGGETVLMWTTHSSFTTQSNCLKMFTRNSTTLKHTTYLYKWLSPYFLSVACKMMCVVKIFSVSISCPFHVWDIGFFIWPSCIPLPGCFSMNACTAICLKSC